MPEKAKKQFKIICLDTHLYWNEERGGPFEDPTLYDSGKLAEKHATHITFNLGGKWQVRPHIVDKQWREREAKRFYDGTYYPVPWDSENWFQNSKYGKDHYAHISKENDVRIAYTANEDAGIADKQTRIKPGRYLEQYFGNILHGDTIRGYVSEFSILHEDIQLKFASTADMIEKVYVRGPGSCMDGKHKFPQNKVHPTRAYAGPDLAVAYLEKDKSEVKKRICQYCETVETGCYGRCDERGAATREDTLYSARAICWPDKKLYGRMYGDVDRLALALKREGFKVGVMDGARLTRMPLVIKNEYGLPKDAFSAPYIDGHHQALRDDGQYLIIDPKGQLKSTAGGYAADLRPICTDCRQPFEADNQRLLLNSRGDANEVVCQECFTLAKAMRCAQTNDWARRKDAIIFDRFNVHKVHVDRFVVVCSKTNVCLIRSDRDTVKMADNSFVSRQWFEETNAKMCNGCGCGMPEGDFKCTKSTKCYGKSEWALVGTNVYHRTDRQYVSNAPPMSAFCLTYDEVCHLQTEARHKQATEREAQRQKEIAEKRKQAQRLRRQRERAALREAQL